MTMTSFNDSWTFRRLEEPDSIGVTLPHDAMIAEQRSPVEPTGSHGAYFAGGRYLYAKTWMPSPDLVGRHVSLFFEGVYGDTRIRLDGEEVATSVSGYREFAVPMPVAAGRSVSIEVEVDNSAVPNSRWYTGSGIYRSVWLVDVAAAHIQSDGIGVTTARANGVTTATITVTAENPDGAALGVLASLESPDARKFRGEAALVPTLEGDRAEITLAIPDPQLWSAEAPHLHTLVVELVHDGRIVDERRSTIGLRTIEVDPHHGLRINGNTVLLRGACVHHDNGVLGAATLRAAEYRRARTLKAAGFNAIRSSHNPLSRAFLDACDELGLYVLDELTDVWFGPKTAHDLAPRFEELWRDDARSMIAKDRLHPSVIMYSIGNEIAESGTIRGVSAAQELSDFVRGLDPDRPTTIAVNFLLNVMAACGRSMFDTSEHDQSKADHKPSAATSTMANVLANRIGGMMQLVSKLPKADKVSRQTFETVDVAGYNYAWGRYAGDAKRHPDRVVLGTESMPGDIVKIWKSVARLPNVIGDFLWTGWDYLGESGIGTWSYGSAPAAISKAYPELVAGCGLVDITGRPDAALLLAQAAWGTLASPQIAVRPLDHSGEKVRRIAWRSTDAVQSWAWSGCDGRAAEIEVYSLDDKVELLINGRSLGHKPVGSGLVVRYNASYEPGEIVAVGYRGGVETARSTLRSAGATRLRVSPESDFIVADGRDAAFIRIELVDDNGIVEMLDDDTVTVEIVGAATLAGLGSGARATEESFVDAHHHTWRGSALAVIRSDGSLGEITVSVSSERHGVATAALTAVAAQTARIVLNPVSDPLSPR